MERHEMYFEYDETGYAELEEMETVFRVVYGFEFVTEYREEVMVLVWYE